MPLPILMLGLELAKLAAPWIAEKVSGEKGAEVAKVLVNAAETVTGKSGDETLEALRADPNLVLQYQSRILTEDTARINAILADIQDARGTMTKLAGMGSSLAWGAAIVSSLVIAANVLATYLVFTTTVPKGQGDLAYLIVGQLLGMGSTVVAFWLGSSMSSVQKTDMMGRR